MAKHIIICCDGTSIYFGDKLANVLKLFSVLEKESGIANASISGTPKIISRPVRLIED